MTTLQIVKSSLLLSPVSMFPAKKRRWIYRHPNDSVVLLKLRKLSPSSVKKVRVFCSVQGDGSNSNGDEPPESLFMKELRRRGMTPASLLEETKRSGVEIDEDSKWERKDGSVTMKSAVSTTNVEPNLSDQRQRSMSLNSEGLEGLIPRAKLLLTLGGTFFLAFRPFIISTIAIFSALYFYFGSTFIHDGTDKHVSMPHYIDPYELLEDERISQIAPRIN